MRKAQETKAIGDAADPRALHLDPNGPETAVGVPHPENRPEGQKLPAVDLSGFELDDYDDDKQRAEPANTLPPDQDPGESFEEIVDVGETSREHHARSAGRPNSDSPNTMAPTVDNQTNQPDRFHNRNAKPTAG